MKKIWFLAYLGKSCKFLASKMCVNALCYLASASLIWYTVSWKFMIIYHEISSWNFMMYHENFRIMKFQLLFIPFQFIWYYYLLIPYYYFIIYPHTFNVTHLTPHIAYWHYIENWQRKNCTLCEVLNLFSQEDLVPN